MAFMTSTDLMSLLELAPDNDFRADLMELVVPSQLAIDRVIQALPPQASALPRVGKVQPVPAPFRGNTEVFSLNGENISSTDNFPWRAAKRTVSHSRCAGRAALRRL